MDRNAGQEETTDAEPDSRVFAKIRTHVIVNERDTDADKPDKPQLSDWEPVNENQVEIGILIICS